MVALLWEAGDVLAAIDLETLWNELAGERLSLYCAYRSDSVMGHEQAGALHEVSAALLGRAGTRQGGRISAFHRGPIWPTPKPSTPAKGTREINRSVSSMSAEPPSVAAQA